MNAVFLNEIGGRLQLQEVTTPRTGNSQVSIKLPVSGVNSTKNQIRLVY